MTRQRKGIGSVHQFVNIGTEKALLALLGAAGQYAKAGQRVEARLCCLAALEIALRRLFLTAMDKRHTNITGVVPLADKCRAAKLIDRPTWQAVVELAEIQRKSTRSYVKALIDATRAVLESLRKAKPIDGAAAEFGVQSGRGVDAPLLPEESIEQRRDAIQAGWSNAERRNRRHGTPDPTGQFLPDSSSRGRHVEKPAMGVSMPTARGRVFERR